MSQRRTRAGARIEDLLKEGQEIVVQVNQEPISTKGARVTRYIRCRGGTWCSCPPSSSRHLAPDSRRTRSGAGLREIIDQMRPQARVHRAHGGPKMCPTKDLRADMDFLIKLWNNVVQRTENQSLPVADLQRLDLLLPRCATCFTARRGQADHRFASRIRSDQEVSSAAFMPDFAGQIELNTSAEPSSTATASKSKSTVRWNARCG